MKCIKCFTTFKVHQTVAKEEKDNKESSKLLHNQKGEFNNYFFQAYIKTYFKEKIKEKNHLLQVSKLCHF